MPVRNMRPEDDQPLARPVHEQRLARPASEEQAEAAQEEAEGEQDEPRRAEEASQGDKGPIARTMDSAQENNWVYDSVASKARETGLVDKADEILDKARNTMSGG